MTTREVAEKIIRESVCNHGPGAECSEYHEQDIIDRIDVALRNEQERAFDQGYVCAVANIMRLHGEDVIAQDVLRENRPRDWGIIDNADLEALRPIFEHEAALAEIEVLKGYQAIREGN